MGNNLLGIEENMIANIPLKLREWVCICGMHEFESSETYGLVNDIVKISDVPPKSHGFGMWLAHGSSLAIGGSAH